MYYSYLKFFVVGLGGTVQSAKIRLFVSDASNDGGAIYLVSNNYANSSIPWDEGGLVWNNAPVIIGNPLSSVGVVSQGTTVEFDVSTAIAGDGEHSFALKSNSSDLVNYTSKEGSNPPVLQIIIDSGSSPSPAPVITFFTPTSGPVGTEVTIMGSKFAGTTEVQFNGVSATTFSVESDNEIRATVPVDASSGKISVTNSAGTTMSASTFTVTVPLITIMFNPTDDAYVKSTEPAINFGSSSSLRVRNSSTVYYSYLKFFVVGLTGTVQSAKIRFYVSDASNDGGAIHLVSNNYEGTSTSWNEGGLKWDNAPKISGTALNSVSAVVTGSTIEFDVLAAFSGDGEYSFAIKNNSTDELKYHSTEGTNPPQLVITMSAGSSNVPMITSFTPTSGEVGIQVTIAGDHLSGVSAVSFGGVATTTFTGVSDTQVLATVPIGAATGKIRVTTPAGTGNSATNFTVNTPPPPAPVVSSFTPTSGPVGTTVTITGSSFTATTSVKFNTTLAASFSLISDSEIRVGVPMGANTGKISITNAGGTGASAVDFTVTSPAAEIPLISSFTPTSGPVTTNVTISGSHFTSTNAVKFNNMAAQFSLVSDIELRAVVPTNATTGKIAVTNASGTGTSSADFVVTSTGGSNTLIFNPADDVFVWSANPSNNYASSPELRVRKTSADQIAYFKFNVTGLTGSVVSAKLRLLCIDSSPDGGSIYKVSNNFLNNSTPWTEGGLIWTNAPAVSGSALKSAGKVTAGQAVELDVRAAITGNGVFSFAIKNNSTDAAYFSSKEGAQAPQLEIQTSGSSIAAKLLDETVDSEPQPQVQSIPESLELFSNYPNPFNLETTIKYGLPEAGDVRLVIYNLRGQEVRTLVDNHQPAGYQTVRWDGRDNSGMPVSSGLYFMRLFIGANLLSQKLTLQK